MVKKSGLYYGYWIMLAGFLGIAIQSGAGFYAFSLFIRPLQAEFGWSRGGISLAFTIWFLLMGLASPFIGRLIDRHGVKKIMFTGALVTGVGFVSLSLIQALWHFYLSYALLGVGMAALGQVPASTMVSNWFKKRRGMSIGIMSTGLGVGGFALAPLVGGYLIPGFGWRVAYLSLAVIAWVVVIPVALFVARTRPEDMGLRPIGWETAEASPAAAQPADSGGLTLRMSLATPAFWLIMAVFFLSQVSQVGATQSQVPYLQDIGFPLALAATALGAVGLFSGFGKVIFGWLCDLIPPKRALAIGLSLQLTSVVALLAVTPESSMAPVWVYAVTMGLGMGSWLPTMSMLTSSNFGLAYYGAIFGVITLAQSTGSAIGPLMAGYMYDAMQTYHWAFVIFIGLSAVSIPAVLLVRRPRGQF
ncbi:MAG: MFS transporter [Chloroflexota bacterium]